MWEVCELYNNLKWHGAWRVSKVRHSGFSLKLPVFKNITHVNIAECRYFKMDCKDTSQKNKNMTLKNHSRYLNHSLSMMDCQHNTSKSFRYVLQLHWKKNGEETLTC